MADHRSPHADEAGPVPEFPLVLRGYDRAAVRAFALEQVREVDALRRELAAVRRENQALREGYTLPARGLTALAGKGGRAERLLQLAEEEAAAVRAAGVQDAARLLERAHEQAEAHLRATADEIESECAALGAGTSRRETALHAAEQRSAADLAAAEDRAQQLVTDAWAEADAIRARAEAEAEALVDRARAETDRLTAVGRSARADLARLLTVIAEGLPDDHGTGSRPARRAAADAGATGDPGSRSPGTRSTGTRSPGTRSTGTDRVTDRPETGAEAPDTADDRSGPARGGGPDDGRHTPTPGVTPAGARAPARLPHPLAVR